MSSFHNDFIRRCLALAEFGRGSTGTNPMVGAVMVRDGKIIAEEFHEQFGKAHAERQLLESVILSLSKDEQKMYSTDPTSPDGLRGASALYVNLEPCCHANKKTPPCTQFLVEKGVKRLVYGMRDPNPEVSGKGIAFLRSRGVEVVGPILEDACMRLNRGFVSLQTLGRPWITLKMARTTDGKFAKLDGSPMQITSKEQDAWSHQFLRARHDAILVGVNTIVRDDPQLNIRYEIPNSKFQIPNLFRIILDPHLKIPVEAKVVNSPLAERTFVIVAQNADQKKAETLRSRGVRVLEVPVKGSAFDWSALWKALTSPTPDFHGITSILVEGGPTTWKIFRDENLVDQEVTLIG